MSKIYLIVEFFGIWGRYFGWMFSFGKRWSESKLFFTESTLKWNLRTKISIINKHKLYRGKITPFIEIAPKCAGKLMYFACKGILKIGKYGLRNKLCTFHFSTRISRDTTRFYKISHESNTFRHTFAQFPKFHSLKGFFCVLSQILKNFIQLLKNCEAFVKFQFTFR